MTRMEYERLRNKAYILSAERQEKMIANGWRLICLSFNRDESDIVKLNNYNNVKIYKGTTAVRGMYNYFAMVK